MIEVGRILHISQKSVSLKYSLVDTNIKLVKGIISQDIVRLVTDFMNLYGFQELLSKALTKTDLSALSCRWKRRSLLKSHLLNPHLK